MTDSVESAKDNHTLERIVSKIKTASAQIPRLLIELAVVFIGVYLAFLLTDYQEELEKQDIRTKFYESLIFEFSTVNFHLGTEERNMLPHLSAVEELSQGKQPRIPTRSLYYPVPGLVVAAAFDSRNFESLNTETIEVIVEATPYMESLKQKINTFNHLLVLLLSAQQSDANCCYNDEGKLLEQYSWYPELVSDIHELNQRIRKTIVEKALPDLQKLKDS